MLKVKIFLDFFVNFCHLAPRNLQFFGSTHSSMEDIYEQFQRNGFPHI